LKILKTPERIVPITVKDKLKKMFSITNVNDAFKRSKQYGPFNIIEFTSERISRRDYDIPYAKWVCETIVKRFKYSGIAAPTQHSQRHGGRFHHEFIFCNTFKWLERDTSDKVMYARRLVIDLTADFNVKRVAFPSSIVANMFNFEEQKGLITPQEGEHLEVSGKEMKSPKVDLG